MLNLFDFICFLKFNFVLKFFMKISKFHLICTLIFLSSVIYQMYWLREIELGKVPGPVDPFLKTVQGYSLFESYFKDQGIYYSFLNIDPNYEFCFFQKDIFTFRLGDKLLGPFPISFTAIVAVLFHFLDFQSIPYFFVILNLILSILIFLNVRKSIPIAILVFFGLPFFIPNSEVSEHSILILTQLAGYYFTRVSFFRIRRREKEISKEICLAGFFFGIGLFFRHEVLIFGNLLIVTLLGMKLLGKNTIYKWRDVIAFCLCMYLMFILFFLMNKFMYGSSVGPRLNTNSSGVYSDLFSKLSYYKVILWRDGSNYGLFGKNLIFVGTFILSALHFRKMHNLDKLFLFPSIGLILAVPILAPNDGGSPWGARYLFLCIYPLVYLTAKYVGKYRRTKSAKLAYLVNILVILSVAQTMSIEKRGLTSTRLVAKQQLKYKDETAILDADLIIFTSELVAMQTGFNYINLPVVLLKNEEKLISFQDKFLNKKDRFKKIVLIEPRTEMINLTKFSASDLEGIQPLRIIDRLDSLLTKKDMEIKELTIVHRYENK